MDLLASADQWVGIYEKRISENSNHKYIVGEKITILDFALAAIGFSSFLNEGNEAYEALKPIAEKH